MLLKIMFIYTPIISIGICFYISKNKTKCSLLLLDAVDSISSSYNYIYNTIENTMCTYFKESHDDLRIHTVQTYTIYTNPHTSIVIQKVSYYYTDILYTIVYDDDNSPNVPIYKGNVLKLNTNNKNKSKIIMCEWMDKRTHKKTIVTDQLLHIIKQYGGPNNDFYNYKEQPLYFTMNEIKHIIDHKKISDIDSYVLQITYDDMDMINKNIKIII
jgi:hypothetical protein